MSSMGFDFKSGLGVLLAGAMLALGCAAPTGEEDDADVSENAFRRGYGQGDPLKLGVYVNDKHDVNITVAKSADNQRSVTVRRGDDAEPICAGTAVLKREKYDSLWKKGLERDVVRIVEAGGGSGCGDMGITFFAKDLVEVFDNPAHDFVSYYKYLGKK